MLRSALSYFLFAFSDGKQPPAEAVQTFVGATSFATIKRPCSVYYCASEIYDRGFDTYDMPSNVYDIASEVNNIVSNTCHRASNMYDRGSIVINYIIGEAF